MNRVATLSSSAYFACCLLFFTFSLLLISCKKDSLITSGDARIAINVDSLKYDTVFTSVGSVTQSFKINNLNNQRLRLTEVRLMGGTTSSFTININGASTTELQDVEIAAEDSIYLFVTVSINPNAANLPFVVRDSIRIEYNGNTRFIQLEAYGQNANFLRNKIIAGNITWTDNLPYVIMGSLLVDTNAILTIDPGCRIYSHADAPIIIDGSLVVTGTKPNPVIFSGDRLDEEYRNLPASWPGIYFRGSSKNNHLTFTTVKNAYQALVAEQPSGNSNPKLLLQHCVIDNAYDAGILCVNSSLRAENCLVSNCGKNIYLMYGGQYDVINCTVASYSVFGTRKSPVLTVTNSIALNGANITANLSASFRNCIFWGGDESIEDEVMVQKEGNTVFNVNFDHCLYKVKTDPANSSLNNVIKNEDPLFDSIDVSKRIFDFHISRSEGPGINQGISTGLNKDLDGNPRPVVADDIGCYEQQ